MALVSDDAAGRQMLRAATRIVIKASRDEDIFYDASTAQDVAEVTDLIDSAEETLQSLFERAGPAVTLVKLLAVSLRKAEVARTAAEREALMQLANSLTSLHATHLRDSDSHDGLRLKAPLSARAVLKTDPLHCYSRVYAQQTMALRGAPAGLAAAAAAAATAAAQTVAATPVPPTPVILFDEHLAQAVHLVMYPLAWAHISFMTGRELEVSAALAVQCGGSGGSTAGGGGGGSGGSGADRAAAARDSGLRLQREVVTALGRSHLLEHVSQLLFNLGIQQGAAEDIPNGQTARPFVAKHGRTLMRLCRQLFARQTCPQFPQTLRAAGLPGPCLLCLFTAAAVEALRSLAGPGGGSGGGVDGRYGLPAQAAAAVRRVLLTPTARSANRVGSEPAAVGAAAADALAQEAVDPWRAQQMLHCWVLLLTPGAGLPPDTWFLSPTAVYELCLRAARVAAAGAAAAGTAAAAALAAAASSASAAEADVAAAAAATRVAMDAVKAAATDVAAVASAAAALGDSEAVAVVAATAAAASSAAAADVARRAVTMGSMKGTAAAVAVAEAAAAAASNAVTAAGAVADAVALVASGTAAVGEAMRVAAAAAATRAEADAAASRDADLLLPRSAATCCWTAVAAAVAAHDALEERWRRRRRQQPLLQQEARSRHQQPWPRPQPQPQRDAGEMQPQRDTAGMQPQRDTAGIQQAQQQGRVGAVAAGEPAPRAAAAAREAAALPPAGGEVRTASGVGAAAAGAVMAKAGAVEAAPPAPVAAAAAPGDEAAAPPPPFTRARPSAWWAAGVAAIDATAAAAAADVAVDGGLWDDVVLLVRYQLKRGQMGALELLRGPLPPTPPPDVAAALSAGYLPALERLLRQACAPRGSSPTDGGAAKAAAAAAAAAASVARASPAQAARAGPLLLQLLSWRSLAPLLAYGEPRQGAALLWALYLAAGGMALLANGEQADSERLQPLARGWVDLVGDGLEWAAGRPPAGRRGWRREEQDVGPARANGICSGGSGGSGGSGSGGSGGSGSGGSGGGRPNEEGSGAGSGSIDDSNSGGNGTGGGDSGGSGDSSSLLALPRQGDDAAAASSGGGSPLRGRAARRQLLTLLTYAFARWLPLGCSYANGVCCGVLGTAGRVAARRTAPGQATQQRMRDSCRDLMWILGAVLDGLDAAAAGAGAAAAAAAGTATAASAVVTAAATAISTPGSAAKAGGCGGQGQGLVCSGAAADSSGGIGGGGVGVLPPAEAAALAVLLLEDAAVLWALCSFARAATSGLLPAADLAPLRRVMRQLLRHFPRQMAAKLRSCVGGGAGSGSGCKSGGGGGGGGGGRRVAPLVSSFIALFGRAASLPDAQLAEALRTIRDGGGGGNGGSGGGRRHPGSIGASGGGSSGVEVLQRLRVAPPAAAAAVLAPLAEALYLLGDVGGLHGIAAAAVAEAAGAGAGGGGGGGTHHE